MAKTIKIFGDKLKIRKTYDIDDFGIGCYGFEVYDKDKLLCHFIGNKIGELKHYIKVTFYKSYEGAHSYYK